MLSTTRSSSVNTGPFIVSLDVGSSSVRTAVFDGAACQVDGLEAQHSYEIRATDDGGVEVDADELLSLALRCLSETHAKLQERQLEPAAIAACGFWHSCLGVDENLSAITPIIHLFDTRSAAAVKVLAGKLDAKANHARTGCVLHTSYWPAKLVWLSETYRPAFRQVRYWLSFGEYLFAKLFGTPLTSTSMVSGSGIWNQNLGDYDAEILKVLPLERGQLAPIEDMDREARGLTGSRKQEWPLFAAIPWFPMIGDGASNNIGSGCDTPGRFSLMVGTSGAMRVVVEQEKIEIPEGLWCYRVDRRRFVLGGALSNGGAVYAWMKRTLALPADDELERQLAALPPGAHGVTMLPLFAGERSPNWRSDARGAMTGLGLSTTPVEIVRASLEAVALRFRQVYDLMKNALGEPKEVIASGGALLHSPVWTQMMADALSRPVVACKEHEASSRGAALLALERLGHIGSLHDLPAAMGETYRPDPGHAQIFERLLPEQKLLYAKLYQETASCQ